MLICNLSIHDYPTASEEYKKIPYLIFLVTANTEAVCIFTVILLQMLETEKAMVGLFSKQRGKSERKLALTRGNIKYRENMSSILNAHDRSTETIEYFRKWKKTGRR